MDRNRGSRKKGAKSHSQYHLLLTVGIFGFNLQLLNVLVPDLWSFSGAPALVGWEEIRHTLIIMRPTSHSNKVSI